MSQVRVLLAALVFTGLIPFLRSSVFVQPLLSAALSVPGLFLTLYQYSIFISVDNKYYSSSCQGWISDKSGSVSGLF